MAILNLFKLTTFAYLDCSILLICCSGWVWESVPTNKVSVAILSRSNHRLTGLNASDDAGRLCHTTMDFNVANIASSARIVTKSLRNKVMRMTF